MNTIYFFRKKKERYIELNGLPKETRAQKKNNNRKTPRFPPNPLIFFYARVDVTRGPKFYGTTVVIKVTGQEQNSVFFFYDIAFGLFALGQVDVDD